MKTFTRSDHPSLARALTLMPAMALIVTNVVGTGIFTKTRAMTCNVGSPWLVLLAFLAAGLLTLAGALTFAELGAMLPRSGGHYNYIGAAFGRFWAFLFGWMETLLDGAASVAAIAMVFAAFLNDLTGNVLSSEEVLLATLAMIGVTSLLASASMHTNASVVAVVTALKLALIVGIGSAAFFYAEGSFAHFTGTIGGAACADVPPGARNGAAGFGAAMSGALWAYNGWADLSFVAEEVRRPAVTLPRAIIGSSLIVMALYFFVNVGYFFALDAKTIAGLPATASVAGAVLVRLFGAGGASLLIAAMMISTAGALHSTSLSIARIPFGMARDGLLPAWLASVSPNSQVPVRATLVVGACAALFALSGTFDALTDMIVFALLFFNAMGVASVYALRRTASPSSIPCTRLSVRAGRLPAGQRGVDAQHPDLGAGRGLDGRGVGRNGPARVLVLRAAFAGACSPCLRAARRLVSVSGVFWGGNPNGLRTPDPRRARRLSR